MTGSETGQVTGTKDKNDDSVGSPRPAFATRCGWRPTSRTPNARATLILATLFRKVQAESRKAPSRASS
jgi:hypothetical protein